jgi:hypothetical protein
MNDASDFNDINDSVYVDLAGETSMLLGRWIYIGDDQCPLAKVNLRAHMSPRREEGGGLSVQTDYAVDIFICEGKKKVHGQDVPNWKIRMHQEPGEWDSEMLASCAKIARDPARELFNRDSEAKTEITKRAPELSVHFEKMTLSAAIPKAEFTSGKETSKWL